MTKSLLTTVCCALLAVSNGLAQGTPAPKPSENGPSLDVTMKFIQDQLNEQGQLNYIVSAPDQPPVTVITDMSNVLANPAACRLTYHIHGVAIPSGPFYRALTLELPDVRDLSVMTIVDPEI